MSAADHLQARLFPLPPKPEPTDVTEWVSQNRGPEYDDEGEYGGRTFWHSSVEERLPKVSRDIKPALGETDEDYKSYDGTIKPWSSDTGHPLGFHAGTARSAIDRGGFRFLHPVRVSGHTSDYSPYDSELWSDNAANGGETLTTDMVRGENVLYENRHEDPGSTAIRAPRENLHTWAEHVRSFPHEHTLQEIRAAKQGFDLLYQRGSHVLGITGAGTPPGVTAQPLKVFAVSDVYRTGGRNIVPTFVQQLPEASPRKKNQQIDGQLDLGI